MTKEQNKHSIAIGIACIAVLLAVVLCALSAFSRKVNRAVEGNIRIQLQEVALQQEKIIDEFINSKLAYLNLTAVFLAEQDNIDSPSTRQMINSEQYLNGFQGINICQSDGSFISMVSGEHNTAAQRDYFIASMNGNQFVSDPLVSVASGERIIVLSVPINKNGAVIGVLCGIIRTEEFKNLFNITSFNGLGYAAIIDTQDGSIIGLNTQNGFDVPTMEEIEQTAYYDGDSYDKLRENISKYEEFGSVFDINGEKSHAYFIPLTFNNCYLCSITPDSVMDNYTKPIQNAHTLLSIIVGAVFILTIVLMIVYFRKYQKLLLTQATENKNKFQQAEAYNKSMLKNSITTSKYDINDDRFIEMPTSWVKLFNLNPDGGYDEVITGLAEASVHPDDRARFLAVSKEYLKECYEKGIPNIELRYRRIVDKNGGGMKWMKNIMYLSKDPVTGHAISMAVVEDIDEENKKIEELKQSAERDPLTGIYNRKSILTNIESYLKYEFSTGSTAILMMVDVDDFKTINDSMGHSCGDDVLIKISEIIRSEFRSSDIYGRIGGDEFIVFCKDVVNAEYAQKKAQTFCDHIASYEFDPTSNLRLSCSIGYSIAPRDGTTFDELYKNADTAMYNAKKLGKGCCMMFDTQMEQGQNITTEFNDGLWEDSEE